MIRLDLDGKWRMKTVAGTQWMPARVPGSVLGDLLDNGVIEDPFYRDNAVRILPFTRDDYEYEREFEAPAGLLACDRVLLVCRGLDTLADIYVNGRLLASADNMHRTWEFDVKRTLQRGTNRIRIVFRSALNYIEERHRENPVWSSTVGTVAGINKIRKSHCSFGWDWGPILPDMGIWRSVSIQGYSVSRLSDVYVTQRHDGNGRVGLNVRIRREALSGSARRVSAAVTLYDPDGNVARQEEAACPAETNVSLAVPNPQLWWPNGYGAQPLYKLEVALRQDGVTLDRQEITLGLRTIEWRREPDAHGESFEAVVNGKSVFAMGANYIPEDALIGRCTPERTERLIRDCARAHFNMLRIWGGAFFQEDYVYDLCDRYGLLVWQDLMFACAAYEMTDEFTESIVRETADNVKRLRHHACLALWCGNNEMEVAWAEWDFPKTPKLRSDYIKQFEWVLPRVVKEHDPNTFYWLASPSSGGGFDNPNDPSRGDVHFWDVWHGTKPFTEYRRHFFRFCSEFGFQSLPDRKTIDSFTLPEDRTPFSYVMETHQCHPEANGKIMNYLAQMLPYPKDLDALVYASQIVQAEAIRYGVEFWRQNRGVCMGSIYWQLNDCWPVVSWSSIDYCGRWKALHYFAKRFYSPVLLSAREEDAQVSLYVTNDSPQTVAGELVWKLRDHASAVLKEGSVPVSVASLTAYHALQLDFSESLPTMDDKRKAVLEYALKLADGTAVSRGTVLFVRAKHFAFLPPSIRAEVREDDERFVIRLQADAYARYVELSLARADMTCADNYIDLFADDPVEVAVWKRDVSEPLSLAEFAAQLRTCSLYDLTESSFI